MNNSIIATIAIGISSISFIMVFEVQKRISDLQNEIETVQLDKGVVVKFSRLANDIGAYRSVHVILYLMGFLSALAAAVCLMVYFPELISLKKIPLKQISLDQIAIGLSHCVLAICSFLIMLVFLLMFTLFRR